jgi:NO-binding membrane sensor protein with MHYT domain
MLKWLFMLATDVILSGFFGLGIALMHLLWLEFATVKFPRVHYTDTYQAAFSLACAAVFFVVALARQIQSRLDCKFLRPREIGFLLVFIAIAMFCLTPVPGSSFPKYLYEINYPANTKASAQPLAQPAAPQKK